MARVYEPRRVDVSSWDAWQSDLAKQLLALEPDENLCFQPLESAMPPTAPADKPTLKDRMRRRPIFAAPLLQTMRMQNVLYLDLTGPVAMGGDFRWSPTQIEQLGDLGWLDPLKHTAPNFYGYLPDTPLALQYLRGNLSVQAAEIIALTLRDITGIEKPDDIEVTGAILRD